MGGERKKVRGNTWGLVVVHRKRRVHAAWQERENIGEQTKKKREGFRQTCSGVESGIALWGSEKKEANREQVDRKNRVEILTEILFCIHVAMWASYVAFLEM